MVAIVTVVVGGGVAVVTVIDHVVVTVVDFAVVTV